MTIKAISDVNVSSGCDSPCKFRPPVLSIVIATYNRAFLVDEALSSLANQRDPISGESLEQSFEILVVDNASTDTTKAVADYWKERLPNLRYFLEVQQGVNFARNRGIAEAGGEYLVFMDDECTVDEDYVSKVLVVLCKHSPILFGGPVYPRYPHHPPKPSWFCDKYGTFSHFSNDVSPENLWLSGANMGGARDVFNEVGGFSIQLGPKGGRMIYGEEHELTERIRLRFGYTCVQYFPNVVVYHLVRPEKFSVMANLREHGLRGYWRGRLYYMTLPSEDGVYRSAVNAKNTSLIFDLIRSPFFRDRGRYPYIQNYIIEVLAPFVRVIFLGLGRLHCCLSKSISRIH